MSKKGIIKTQYGDGIENYQKRIKETIVKSLNTHPRTALIRLDLRFPGEDMFYRDDPAVITDSLNHLMNASLFILKISESQV